MGRKWGQINWPIELGVKRKKSRPTNIEDQYINFLKIRAQLGSQRYVPWRTQLWIMDEPNSIFVGLLLSRSFYLIGSNSHSPQNFLLHMVHSPKILHLEQKAKKQHVLVWKCTTSWFCWSVCREFSAPPLWCSSKSLENFSVTPSFPLKSGYPGFISYSDQFKKATRLVSGGRV